MTIALVTLAVGPKGRELLDISGPLLRRWAAKLGASFTVIDRAPDGYPLAGKFHLCRIVARHDRTVFVDADTIPNVDAMPSILDAVPVDSVGMHDDLPKVGDRQWAHDLYKLLHKEQGFGLDCSMAAMWNTGVIVASRQHADAFRPPAKAFTGHHCSEQFLIQIALERAGVPMHRLDAKWNYQWWFRRSMPTLLERPDLYVRHFAGTSQPQTFGVTHTQRLAMMRAASAELEGRPNRENRKCLFLGRRTELRAGCATGYGCRHECEKGHTAIPAATCQRCPDFDDDGRF